MRKASCLSIARRVGCGSEQNIGRGKTDEKMGDEACDWLVQV